MKKIKYTILLIIILVLSFNTKTVNASSLTVTLDKTSVQVGDTFTAIVNYSGTKLGSATFNVSYTNATCTQSYSVSSIYSQKGSSFEISLPYREGGYSSGKLFTLNCTATSVGSSTVKASITNGDAWDEEGMNTVSVSTGESSIKINKKTNATLSIDCSSIYVGETTTCKVSGYTSGKISSIQGKISTSDNISIVSVTNSEWDMPMYVRNGEFSLLSNTDKTGTFSVVDMVIKGISEGNGTLMIYDITGSDDNYDTITSTNVTKQISVVNKTTSPTWSVEYLGYIPATLDNYNSLGTSPANKIKVTSNGVDVTSKSNISAYCYNSSGDEISCNTMTNPNIYTVKFVVRYNGQTRYKQITLNSNYTNKQSHFSFNGSTSAYIDDEVTINLKMDSIENVTEDLLGIEGILNYNHSYLELIEIKSLNNNSIGYNSSNSKFTGTIPNNINNNLISIRFKIKKAGTSTINILNGNVYDTKESINPTFSSITITGVSRPTIPTTGIVVSNTNYTLPIGNTTYVNVYATPSNTTDNNTYTYWSDNNYIASFNNGVITANHIGSIWLHVRSNTGFQKDILVNVYDPTPSNSAKRFTVTGIKNYTYTGTSKKPTVKVKFNGKTLRKNKDYKVSYGTNKYLGLGYVYVKGINKYCDTAVYTFKITPKKTSIKTPRSYKGSIKVSWTKQPGATGYLIAYRLKGSSYNYIDVPGTSSSYYISNLLSKKQYQVKVQTYVDINGQRYFGSWSTLKTIKTK